MDPDVYFLRRNKSPPQLRDIGPDSSSSLSPNCPDLSFQLLTPALVTPGQTCHLLWTPWCINLKPQHVWAIASILRYVSKIKRVIKHRKHGYWGVAWWVFRGPGAATTNFVRKWFFRGQQSALFMGSPSLDTLCTWHWEWREVTGVTWAANLTVNLLPTFQTCWSHPAKVPMFTLFQGNQLIWIYK